MVTLMLVATTSLIWPTQLYIHPTITIQRSHGPLNSTTIILPSSSSQWPRTAFRSFVVPNIILISHTAPGLIRPPIFLHAPTLPLFSQSYSTFNIPPPLPRPFSAIQSNGLSASQERTACSQSPKKYLKQAVFYMYPGWVAARGRFPIWDFCLYDMFRSASQL